MKFFTGIVCFLLLSLSAMAAYPPSMSTADYVQEYSDAAIAEMKRSGIPASILLAQAIIASENGATDIAVENNNHFAIKCGMGWKGEAVFKSNPDAITEECFRAYPDAAASFADYTDLVMEDRTCRDLFQLSYYDYKSWADGLQHCFYTSDKEYAAKLIKLIEKNDLSKYDSPSVFSPVVQKPIIGYEFEIN